MARPVARKVSLLEDRYNAALAFIDRIVRTRIRAEPPVLLVSAALGAATEPKHVQLSDDARPNPVHMDVLFDAASRLALTDDAFDLLLRLALCTQANCAQCVAWSADLASLAHTCACITESRRMAFHGDE